MNALPPFVNTQLNEDHVAISRHLRAHAERTSVRVPPGIRALCQGHALHKTSAAAAMARGTSEICMMYHQVFSNGRSMGRAALALTRSASLCDYLLHAVLQELHLTSTPRLLAVAPTLETVAASAPRQHCIYFHHADVRRYLLRWLCCGPEFWL